MLKPMITSIIMILLAVVLYSLLSPPPKTKMMYLLEDHTSCESYNINNSIVTLDNCYNVTYGKIERVINPVNVREVEFVMKDKTKDSSGTNTP